MAEKVLVKYHCKKTKQTVEVIKGSGKERTLKNHKMWALGALPVSEKQPK